MAVVELAVALGAAADRTAAVVGDLVALAGCSSAAVLDHLDLAQNRLRYHRLELHLGGCLAFAFQKPLFQCYSVLRRLVPTGVCAKSLPHKPLNLYVHIR